MTVLAYIHSTPFRLAPGAGVADAFRERIEEHFYERRVDLEEVEPGVFRLQMEAQDVSDFFVDSVSDFLPKISDLVKDAFEVTLREDTMADERDWLGYAGPTPEAIDALKKASAAREAMELLRRAGIEGPEQLARTLKLASPQVFVVVEGGVVQHVVSSSPLELTVIDYDTDGCEEAQLAHIPQADGVGKPDSADLQQPGVEVSPARAGELEAIAGQFFDRRDKARAPSQKG